MMFTRICAFILFILKCNLSLPLTKEPMCSKFAYEEQLLEKMIRQEINVEMMQNSIKKTGETVSKTLEQINNKTDVAVSLTLETFQNNFKDLVDRTRQDKEKNEEAVGKIFDELRNNLTKEIEEQRKNISRLNENMKKPSVAFFAHNVVDRKLDKTDKIIVFTTTTTNEGSGYDTSTGIFKAPVGGLYQFIVSFCSPRNKYSPIALVMSGNVIARSANQNENSYSCSSFPTVLRVELGEKIWVKCLHGSTSYALQESGWFMNAFSGFLITT